MKNFCPIITALVLLMIALAGCRIERKALPISKVHAITREFAAAAASAAPAGTEIRQFLAAGGSGGQKADSLDITFQGELAEPEERAITTRLLRALDAVATRNSLTQQPMESREGLQFQFAHAGVATHIVHLRFAAKSRATDIPPQITSHPAKLAIILDDLGNDSSAADAIFSLPYPLTLSVLPNHIYSVDIAQEAHRRGYQVMLHLPMQAMGSEKPEAEELRPGMAEAEVTRTVEQMLQSVPFVAGVNNHQGSQATADPALMAELMPLLRDRRVFYVDSRTTAATVAYDIARSHGVRTAFRNVPFLDDVAEVAAIRKQLQVAMKGARDKGEAIAIGHPHTATLQALREILPSAKSQDIQLVFASELVH